MRARNVKPGFFKNEILAECHPLARILFEGLWCLADREGRIEDRPMRIKAEVLPYDAKPDINALLNDLASKHDPDGKPAFIIRYSVGGCKYIQILHFLSHQNPHVREPESSIPAPDKHSASTVQAPDETGSRPALSPIPLPESPIPLPSNNGFEGFWKAYPKKIGKGAAQKAWGKVRPSQGLISQILGAVEIQKQCEQWQKDGGQYIPNPATWLNQKRWEDEVKTTDQHLPLDPKPEIPSSCDRCGLEPPVNNEFGRWLCQGCFDIELEKSEEGKKRFMATFGNRPLMQGME